MSSELAISISNLGKCYQIYEQPRDRLLQMIARRHKFFREFWALKNISFDIQKGETIGIVGRNGSGKSTLLQLISGTLNPTVGQVVTNGRIAALLELGSGFNPEFSGRENVYMNASILGLTKEEIDNKFDSIVGFADIGSFIEQPIKTYSSGMALRLAFAVQAQVEPDILIVDEALAVGDARFQAKCFERLKQLKDNGTSILLVTHSSEQVVTHCSRAILLDQGEIKLIGKPRTVVNNYLDLLFGREKVKNPDIENIDNTETVEKLNTVEDIKVSLVEEAFHLQPQYNQNEYRWGDGKASIMDFSLCYEENHKPIDAIIESGSNLILTISILFKQRILNPILGFTVKTKEGVTIYGSNSFMKNTIEFQNEGHEGSVVVAKLKFSSRLAQGDYFISLGVASREGEDIIPHDRRYDSIHFVVGPVEDYFGLADLSLSIESSRIK